MVKKDISSKRWWYIAGVILFVFLIVIDIVKFRAKNKENVAIQETATEQEEAEEIISEESTDLKEGEDDDYKYQEGIETTTQEDLKPEYEEFYEEFNTEGQQQIVHGEQYGCFFIEMEGEIWIN